jgi:hypothetical protein
VIAKHIKDTKIAAWISGLCLSIKAYRLGFMVE